MDRIISEDLSVENLSVQDHPDRHVRRARALVVGEVLWDVFPDATRLGGAALNFAAHFRRLGHEPRIVSAVGMDALGDAARAAITSLGLDTAFLQTTDRFSTGTASVQLGPGDHTSFRIERPAAYDAVELTDTLLQQVVQWKPAWCYYGTLFASSPHARHVLRCLLDATPDAHRFYDVNLRPDFESRELVCELLRTSHVVKLNERELADVHRWLDLPSDPEAFCRAGAARYGWAAACVTLGARGCALIVGQEYAEAEGTPVEVVDTVGAGDAFAAAFVHGLVANRPAAEIAVLANRAGAAVAAVQGAIPDR